MLNTYAIKGEDKILVTPENKDSLIGYSFVQEELSYATEEERQIAEIEAKLKEYKTRFSELEELGEYRSEAEELEYQELTAGKVRLLQARKALLDNINAPEEETDTEEVTQVEG